MHSQTTEQLDRVRTTVAQHTTDIAHIKSKLEECESTDGESSYFEGSSNPEPRAQEPPTATPQGHEEEEDPHDIEMKDVGDDLFRLLHRSKTTIRSQSPFKLHHLALLLKTMRAEKTSEMTGT